MMRRRIGRPGLLGTMARTAVIAGTATAVSGGVARAQAGRAPAATTPLPPGPSPAAPSAEPVAPPAPDDLLGQLQQLADLRTSGILDEAEFALAKARLLGS